MNKWVNEQHTRFCCVQIRKQHLYTCLLYLFVKTRKATTRKNANIKKKKKQRNAFYGETAMEQCRQINAFPLLSDFDRGNVAIHDLCLPPSLYSAPSPSLTSFRDVSPLASPMTSPTYNAAGSHQSHQIDVTFDVTTSHASSVSSSSSPPISAKQSEADTDGEDHRIAFRDDYGFIEASAEQKRKSMPPVCDTMCLNHDSAFSFDPICDATSIKLDDSGRQQLEQQHRIVNLASDDGSERSSLYPVFSSCEKTHQCSDKHSGSGQVVSVCNNATAIRIRLTLSSTAYVMLLVFSIVLVVFMINFSNVQMEYVQGIQYYHSYQVDECQTSNKRARSGKEGGEEIANATRLIPCRIISRLPSVLEPALFVQRAHAFGGPNHITNVTKNVASGITTDQPEAPKINDGDTFCAAGGRICRVSYLNVSQVFLIISQIYADDLDPLTSVRQYSGLEGINTNIDDDIVASRESASNAASDAQVAAQATPLPLNEVTTRTVISRTVRSGDFCKMTSIDNPDASHTIPTETTIVTSKKTAAMLAPPRSITEMNDCLRKFVSLPQDLDVLHCFGPRYTHWFCVRYDDADSKWWSWIASWPMVFSVVVLMLFVCVTCTLAARFCKFWRSGSSTALSKC